MKLLNEFSRLPDSTPVSCRMKDFDHVLEGNFPLPSGNDTQLAACAPLPFKTTAATLCSTCCDTQNVYISLTLRILYVRNECWVRFLYGTNWLFRRARRIVKSAYYLRNVRPSARLSAFISVAPSARTEEELEAGIYGPRMRLFFSLGKKKCEIRLWK
jgi:hypothetical protein